MANEVKNYNVLLINAPAGSGKTYKIKSDIRDYIIENPKDNILCITYTNRAADELLKGLDSPNIYISTIHSYINDLISPLFSKKEIIDLYFKTYKEDILKRISDSKKQESNNKFKEKYGDLNIETIRQNISTIFYNETQFNSLYYGGLSHDDLLSFTSTVLERYPKLYKKINGKFKIIIIDEYQDTSPDVFNIFFNAIQNTDIKLYLYGDKMQQIYKSYNTELNNKLKTINHENKNVINHRSIPVIVDILNKIYNNNKLYQKYFYKLEKIKPNFKPRVIIKKSCDFDDLIKKIMAEDPKTLVLYIFNKERFEKIGAGNLYNKFSNIKKYRFGNKVSVTDILLNNDEADNQDDLLKLMILMYKINNFWSKKNFGSFLKKCKYNKKIFNINTVTLHSIKDKKKLYDLWKEVFIKFNDSSTTIGELIELMDMKNLLEKKFVDTINSDNIYSEVMGVLVNEIIKLEESNENPNISTQHGVKGESHDSVVFVSEDSKRNKPYVYMYDFFKVWSKVQFSLDEFEDFYFDYANFINSMGDIDCSAKNKDYLINKCNEIIIKFNSNEIFNFLCKDIYTTYLDHPIVKNAYKLFKDNTVKCVLSAYKLFYVGCSRARKNLTVLVDEDKITEYKDELIEKSKNIGFTIL
ncbi:ATP-dependent helicase [Clostridium botulinum]|uniref:UvrD-helicase domain-containing protein n=1 Tax=Clostridium botulinum TaxID=1491 RepID=UPI00217EA476|nr:UvrD-helicase domain-containing protein [Clostridium botulinum]MCS6103538.1 ATP-dependent helicase [Clostridium botulinum]MCS6108575.1 ATP-dependent helicase [Clostridium botulinum]